MFLAALPWTYWMALPLLVGSAAVLVAFTLVYLKRVVEPHVLRLDALLAAAQPSQLSEGGSSHAVAVTTGGPGRRAS